MKFNEIKKIVDGIVENEYRHVEEFLENKFQATDLEYKEKSEITNSIYRKLKEDMTEEQKELLDDLYSSFTTESLILLRFFFKEGLRAGLSNLKFLSEIDFIEYILEMKDSEWEKRL